MPCRDFLVQYQQDSFVHYDEIEKTRETNVDEIQTQTKKNERRERRVVTEGKHHHQYQ